MVEIRAKDFERPPDDGLLFGRDSFRRMHHESRFPGGAEHRDCGSGNRRRRRLRPVVRSLHDHGSDDCLRVSDWGSSFPVFFISISSQIWHKNVECHLADQILLRSDHPNSRIALIAHSAVLASLRAR